MAQPTSITPAPPEDIDFDLADAARRRARRKALWWLAGGFSLLFGLLLWGLVADEPPPDISDLRVAYTRPPEAQNAYALLAKLVAALPPEPRGDTPENRHFARIFSTHAKDQVAWNQSVVAAVLARYPADLVDSVRTALDAPESESPEIKSYADTIPEIGSFRSLAQTLTRLAELAWHGGDHATASEINLLTLRLGDRIRQSRGPLVTVLTGSGIEGIALTAIQKHADSDSIPAETLRHYLAQIQGYEPRPDGHHAAFKLETVAFANTTHTISGPDLASLMASDNKLLGSASTIPGLWQPNRTIRWHADCMRAEITESSSDFYTGSSAGRFSVEKHSAAPWPRRLQNLTGRTVLGMTASIGKIGENYYRGLTNCRLTQIYLALRLHHLEHDGGMPADLAELVPGKIPAIPLDPFDGQPLRYQRDLNTIWSTGPERKAITSAEGDLPREIPAYRLRFALPTVAFPAFSEEETPKADAADDAEQITRETAPSDVSPVK